MVRSGAQHRVSNHAGRHYTENRNVSGRVSMASPIADSQSFTPRGSSAENGRSA